MCCAERAVLLITALRWKGELECGSFVAAGQGTRVCLQGEGYSDDLLHGALSSERI